MEIGLEDSPSIIDVLLVPSPYPHDNERTTREVVFFEGSLRISEDVWLADFETEFARDVLNACSQSGENFRPTRQYGAPYGFVRVSIPYASEHSLHFDHDRRLLTTVALSRLVHPTSIGFQYAARVRRWPNGRREIIPHRSHHINDFAFVVDTSENWLVPDDVPAIGRVLDAYLAKVLPQRIGSALWHFETVARTYYIDIRWPLLVTGLEALVHIAGERDPRNVLRYAGSTRVFVDRLLAVGLAKPALAVPEAQLREIYDRRSTLSHGQSFGSLDQKTKDLYRKTENLLRSILKEAILDQAFAGTFATDGVLETSYPLR
jgi:hypothetical protein